MKILVLLYVLLFNINIINAQEKDIVMFSRCIDGDTAKFIINNEEKSVRFLAIDTPELKTKDYYSLESSNYTCNILTKAKKIELEYDKNSDKHDKYNRVLAWIFVDEDLLQDKIISGGYGEVKYLYGDYKYTSILLKSEEKAKSEKLGIWEDREEKEEYTIYFYIFAAVIIIINYIFKDKNYRKIFKKLKNSV